jgi:hypothetical protein
LIKLRMLFKLTESKLIGFELRYGSSWAKESVFKLSLDEAWCGCNLGLDIANNECHCISVEP